MVMTLNYINHASANINSPVEKAQMFSGDWSVLIISNNGDADPIAYERDFYLSVGVAATTTVSSNSDQSYDRSSQGQFTPTLTLSVTTTPILGKLLPIGWPLHIEMLIYSRRYLDSDLNPDQRHCHYNHGPVKDSCG